MSNEAQVFVAHDPGYGVYGTDVLVTVYPDGTMEVALREGRDETWNGWGPSYDLTDGSVMHPVLPEACS